MHALLLVAEHDGPTIFALIGMMRALHQHQPPRAGNVPRPLGLFNNQIALAGSVCLAFRGLLTTCARCLLRQHIPPVLMRLCLLPEDAGHRIAVGPAKARQFGADISVHLRLAQNEETITGIIGNERQNVEEATSGCLCFDHPRVWLVEPLYVDQKVFLRRGADDHQVSQRRRVAQRERDLIAALAEFGRNGKLSSPLGSMR